MIKNRNSYSGSVHNRLPTYNANIDPPPSLPPSPLQAADCPGRVPEAEETDSQCQKEKCCRDGRVCTKLASYLHHMRAVMARGEAGR